MKKGLRLDHLPIEPCRAIQRPNCCPDEEGIKTQDFKAVVHLDSPFRPNCCPDEEGIKTFYLVATYNNSKPTLSELLP